MTSMRSPPSEDSFLRRFLASAASDFFLDMTHAGKALPTEDKLYTFTPPNSVGGASDMKATSWTVTYSGGRRRQRERYEAFKKALFTADPTEPGAQEKRITLSTPHVSHTEQSGVCIYCLHVLHSLLPHTIAIDG